MHLLTNKGIVEVKETSFLKKLLCKHNDTVSGLECSSRGLVIISGEDKYEVCEDCGKILDESHINF